MSNRYNILIVGAGVMGINHTAAIKDQQKLHPNIKIIGVADINPEALDRFSAAHPDTPTYLLNDTCQIANIIHATNATTLVDATNTNAHPEIIRTAMSIPDAIHTVFQEKPIAVTMTEAEEIAALIRNRQATYSLNSVLMHSPIWYDFEKVLKSQSPLQLEFVRTTYGKDRTKDTRPAVGGYIYLEAIHALDIASHGIVHLIPNSIEATGRYGFLTEKASADGCCLYAATSRMTAVSSTGNPVVIEQEGSLTYQSNYRRVQYGYKRKDGQKLVLQIEFDTKAHGDILQGWIVAPTDGNHKKIEEIAFTNSTAETPNGRIKIDKLFGFYDAVFSGHMRNICNLDRSLELQAGLDKLASVAEQNLIYSPADKSPHFPQLKSCQDMDANDWRAFVTQKMALQL